MSHSERRKLSHHKIHSVDTILQCPSLASLRLAAVHWICYPFVCTDRLKRTYNRSLRTIEMRSNDCNHQTNLGNFSAATAVALLRVGTSKKSACRLKKAFKVNTVFGKAISQARNFLEVIPRPLLCPGVHTSTTLNVTFTDVPAARIF